jgi:hypothetical protein
MSVQSQQLENLQDIRQLMNKSSRFISLSGLSGIAAGICALIAAWVASRRLNAHQSKNGIDYTRVYRREEFSDGYQSLERDLLLIAAVTFLVAFGLAFFFTWLRSRKTGVPIWGHVARKVMVHVAIPMLAGALLMWRMTEIGVYGLIAPSCLIFYGLALINASKFTFSEIRYLGYGQLILGVLNLWMIGYGLLFWAAGFGLLHILYGFIMWYRYERQPTAL